MGASFRNTGEITNLAGCDFLTISPSLLKDLQGSSEDLPRVLSEEKAGQAEPISKVSFVDNEPSFRWSLVNDPMAQEKLNEGELALGCPTRSGCVRLMVSLSMCRHRQVRCRRRGAQVAPQEQAPVNLRRFRALCDLGPGSRSPFPPFSRARTQRVVVVARFVDRGPYAFVVHKIESFATDSKASVLAAFVRNLPPTRVRGLGEFS